MPPSLRLPGAFCLGLILWAGFFPSLDARAVSGPAHGPWGVEISGGVLKLQGGEWDYSAPGLLAGVGLVRELHPHWTLVMGLRHGHCRAGVDEPFTEAGWGGGGDLPLYTVMTQPHIQVRHRFSGAGRISPNFAAGCGIDSWKVIRLPDGGPGWFPPEEPARGYDLGGNEVALEGSDFFWEFRFGCDVLIRNDLALGAFGFYQAGQGNDRDSSGLSSLWGPAQVDANRAAGGGFIGLTWWFGTRDADDDGVPDDRDQCPGVAEDRDGFNDHDGCPDSDNDQDGVPDLEDLCRETAEDFDGFEDQDGCPEFDNDQDGVLDGRDRCPGTPPDTLVDRDGCPLGTR